MLSGRRMIARGARLAHSLRSENPNHLAGFLFAPGQAELAVLFDQFSDEAFAIGGVHTFRQIVRLINSFLVGHACDNSFG